MILQKITDVRVGQIWTFNEGKTYDAVISVRNIDDNFHHEVSEVVFEIWADFDYAIEKKDKEDINNRYLVDVEYTKKGEKVNQDLLEKFKQPDKYLVGFLGITHKIEDRRLVEIKRNKFEVDDIISAKKHISAHCEINLSDCYIIKGQIYTIIDYNEFSNYIMITCLTQSRKVINLKFKDKTEIDKYFGKIGTLGVNYNFINNRLV